MNFSAAVTGVPSGQDHGLAWTLEPYDGAVTEIPGTNSILYNSGASGEYTLKASSKADYSKFAAVTVNVVDLAPAIFDNWNMEEVTNNASGPPNPSTFTLTEPTTMVMINDAHFSIDDLPPNASIGLRDANNITYGPWPISDIGWDYWYVYPNITLQPGEYTVIDSSPETWSYNTESGDAGFARLYTEAGP